VTVTLRRTEFIAHLKETLIPDLLASGYTATAADFQIAILFMEGKEEVTVDEEGILIAE
jgi:hypothetical protein